MLAYFVQHVLMFLFSLGIYSRVETGSNLGGHIEEGVILKRRQWSSLLLRDNISSIPCRASYFALGWVEEYADLHPILQLVLIPVILFISVLLTAGRLSMSSCQKRRGRLSIRSIYSTNSVVVSLGLAILLELDNFVRLYFFLLRKG